MRESYGVTLPGMELADLTGKLIVIEGTDGVGRSTQINLLKPWLEQQGHAVIDTGIKRLIIELELDDVAIFLVHLSLKFRHRQYQLEADGPADVLCRLQPRL